MGLAALDGQQYVHELDVRALELGGIGFFAISAGLIRTFCP